MAFDVMEDCIHLKACRRVQAIGKKFRLNVPRYCTEDCTAYCSGDTLVPVATQEEVQEGIDWACDAIKDGQDWVIVRKIEGHTLKQIIDEMT